MAKPMSTADVLKKYSQQIEGQINNFDTGKTKFDDSGVSKEYSQFKQDMMPELSKYEKLARGLGNFIKIKLSPKDEKKVGKHLEIAHLDVSPSEVVGLAKNPLAFYMVTCLPFTVNFF